MMPMVATDFICEMLDSSLKAQQAGLESESGIHAFNLLFTLQIPTDMRLICSLLFKYLIDNHLQSTRSISHLYLLKKFSKKQKQKPNSY